MRAIAIPAELERMRRQYGRFGAGYACHRTKLVVLEVKRCGKLGILVHPWVKLWNVERHGPCWKGKEVR